MIREDVKHSSERKCVSCVSIETLDVFQGCALPPSSLKYVIKYTLEQIPTCISANLTGFLKLNILAPGRIIVCKDVAFLHGFLAQQQFAKESQHQINQPLTLLDPSSRKYSSITLARRSVLDF